MGGRGASSSSNSREGFIRDIVKNYNDFTRGDLQGAVEAYVMKKGMTPSEVAKESDKLLKEIDDRYGAKASTKLYSNLVNDNRVIDELTRNIEAQKADNPNARVGDTRLDSDRIITNYADKLTPQEYSRFNWEKAEDELFKKLRSLERKNGFRK